jgi:hypothetical protein
LLPLQRDILPLLSMRHVKRALGGCVLLLGIASACDRDAKANRAPPRSKRPAASASTRPPTSRYRDGDLIFQRSTSQQSEMVGALTRSQWTHMGVIFVEPSGARVFEAASPVRHTRLGDWVARGKDTHYVVKRLRDGEKRLSPEVVREMKSLGARWLGRPYDAKFRWDDESLYCSEIVHKLFDRAARVRLGRIERARDMNLDDARVKRALGQRFEPGEFAPDERVVTPQSIFQDEQLVTVHQE